MQFISIGFLVFMTVFVVIYSVVPAKFRRPFLVICNILYYITWAKSILDLIPIAAITLVTWICALIIEKNPDDRAGKIALIFSIAGCIGALAYFKYTNFLLNTFGSVMGFILPGGGTTIS